MKTIQFLLLLFVLSAGVVSAREVVMPLPGEWPRVITAAEDGTVWFAGHSDNDLPAKARVGRIAPNGAVHIVTVNPGTIYAQKIQQLADGSVVVNWDGGANVRVDANFNVASHPPMTVLAFLPVSDGSYWAIDSTRMRHVSTVGVTLSEQSLPFTALSAHATADGTIYAVTSDAIHRGSTAGTFTRLADCDQCGEWIRELHDGTLVFATGALRPNGTLVRWPHAVGSPESAVGPDDRVWFGGSENTLWSVGRDGDLRLLPLESAGNVVLSVSATSAGLVFGMLGEVRRVRADADRGIEFREGDVLAREVDGWNLNPQLVHHRPGVEPFVRRPLYDAGQDKRIHGAVFAHSPSRVLMWWLADAFGVVNGAGVPQSEVVVNGIPNGQRAFVLDRADTMYVASAVVNTPTARFLKIDASGMLRGEIVVPGVRIVSAVDLAADQCTLFFVTVAALGRLNVCTGSVLANFPLTFGAKEGPLDVRLTRDGDVIVAYPERVVRYDRSGSELQTIHAPKWDISAIALDLDPRFLWVGTENDLRKVEWATGAVVEQQRVYYRPTSLSVVGEPRAARAPASRRRSVGH